MNSCPASRTLIIVFLSFFSNLIFTQVSPVQLGRASNIFSILRPEQNQVWADDELNMVSFIHRQDVTIWGGGSAESGKLRYDISTDGGLTFSNDIGVLNSIYTSPARYPQMTGFNLTGSSNPLDQKLIWDAPTLNPMGDWNAPVQGVADITTLNPVSSTENYFPEPVSTYLGSGLTQGLPGEFWSFDVSYNVPGGLNDSLYLQKGIFNPGTQDVDWEIYEWIKPVHNLSFDGTPKVASKNIAFSPDGSVGWAAFLGDLVGGPDSTFNPIFIPSFDGGVTWGNPIEVDLSTVDYITNSDCDPKTIPDVLREVFTDNMGQPLSTGRPTCTFEFDMTVDENGNPHMFVVVGSASTIGSPTPAYSVFSGLVKIALDIYSEDGGATWKAFKVAPIYTFRSPTIGTTPNSVTHDNFPQISRTPDGSHIFYSWVDTDTSALMTISSTNTNPNLRTAGLQVATGLATCPNWVTQGDLVWDGNALFPTMAPEVLVSDDGLSFNLPIVMAQYVAPPSDPVRFWYFGNDAVIENNDFNVNVTAFDVNDCDSKLDEFGYAWEDCNGVCGPAYDWIDITTLPGAVQTTGLADDNSVGPFNIGFDFTYYWNNYDQLRIGSNGWISFGNATNISHCFDVIPTPGGGGDNFLAPYMSDLNFSGAGNPGEVWYWSNQVDTIIISYINVPSWSPNPPGYTGSGTFQVILCAQDNSITYQYESLAPFANTPGCTTELQIGIENVTGEIGLLLYSETFPDNNCAIRFNYPDPVIFQAYDAAVEWNQNNLNRVEILDVGTMKTIQSLIKNVGNQDLTNTMVDADVINNSSLLTAYSSSNNISTLLAGQSNLELFTPEILFDEVGNFSFDVAIANAQDINPLNDSNSSEFLVIDCLEEVVKLDYNIDDNLDEFNSWINGDVNDWGYGMYFNPPVYPFRLDSVELIVSKNEVTTPAGLQNIRVQIISADAPPGLGTVLAEVDIAGADYPDGVPFTIPVGPVEIESDGFYIRWSGDPNTQLNSSNAGPFSYASYEVVGGSWAPSRDQDTTEFHIRAYGQCIFPPIPTLGEWGLMILSLLLMIIGISVIKEFRHNESLMSK